MNPTIEKFGYPATLVHEMRHWLILLRPAQVTLGSLVLAAKSDATRYSDLPDEAFAEQARAVRLIERLLQDFVAFDRINYLMLMMVDPNVHFHVIPRYAMPRTWRDQEFRDAGWSGPPDLAAAVKLTTEQITELVSTLSSNME